MTTELTMPQMGYDMQEGVIVRWLKAEGDTVRAGEPIAEIETDKAVVEFEAYTDGILQKILVSEGYSVPVGQPIAIIGLHATAPEGHAIDAMNSPSTPLVVAAPEPERTVEPETEPEPEPAEPPATASLFVRASPMARRLANQRGIDLSQVEGTGPGGRVTRVDVLNFNMNPEPVAEVELEPVAEVEPEPVAEIEPEPVAEVEPEPVAEVELEPVAEVEPEPIAEVEPEPIAEIEPEPVAEVELEPVAEVEPEPVAEVEPEPVAEVEPEPVAEVEPEPVAEVEPEPVAEVEPEPVAEVEPEPVAEVEPEPEVRENLIPLSRMRQQIARVTVRSKQEKPHFYVAADIEMTEVMQLRRQINAAMEGSGLRITVNDLVVKACVEALKAHPMFNAYYTDEGIQLNDSINVGIAMAQDEGLIVPAIMDCGNKSLGHIASTSKDLAERAKSGALTAQEYSGGTFAVSNLGMFDVSSFVAIIHPPATAVLAVGTVSKRPVVRGDELAVAEMMTATLSADHRVVDGAEGARFLIDVKERLENPLSLVV